VAWSYQLLSGLEQLIFERLSVFAGEFDLAAAEVVSTDEELAAEDVFELLASLVDKSMVIADRREYGTRYRLLETLRQFGAERLDERAGVAPVRGRHLSHFVEVAEQANELWGSPRQLAADAIFEREWDNLRAAHAWAIATCDLAAADALVDATGRHARVRARHEHEDWALSTLRLDAADRHPHPSTFGWAARWPVAMGDYDRGIAIAHRGIQTAPSPDHPDTAGCWSWIVKALVAAGRGAEAVEPVRHLAIAGPLNSDRVAQWMAMAPVIEFDVANEPASLPSDIVRLASLADMIGSPSILSETASYRGSSALYADPPDTQAAHAAFQDGLVLARTAGDVIAECRNLSGLARSATALDAPDARQICRDAITRLYETRFWNVLTLVFEVVAGSFAAAQQLEPAAILYGYLQLHPPWPFPGAERARLSGIEAVRQHPHADELLARGAAMDRDQVVQYALEQLDKPAKAAVVTL
jgi:hypothetical protein